MARIGTRRLARLCHNVGTGLHAGLDIRRLWDSQCQLASSSERRYFEDIRARIAAGDSIASAFKATGGYFPSLFCEMAEVGERTGRLELVFFRLAEHYDQVNVLRRNFLIGIAWPLIELVLGILAVGLLILILGMIGSDTSLFGLSGAGGATIWFSAVGCIAAGIFALIYGIQNGWISPDPMYRLLIHVPVIGKGLEIFSMSRLTWSLAMATDSDLPADKAMELAVRSTQNGYFTDRLDQMKLAVRRGDEMHEAFRNAGVYPADFLDALQTGEISGRISETMTVIAKDYEDRAKIWYRGLALACGALVFLMVAGLMVFMIFHLFYNLYYKTIKDALQPM